VNTTVLDRRIGSDAGVKYTTGLGLSFLFVSTSQLAYCYPPREKNNKAWS